MTERTFAIRALSRLSRAGWHILGVDDGEGMERRMFSPTSAVDRIEAVEHGYVRVVHEKLGAATVCLLFQGGEPDEVVYDFQAATDEAITAVDSLIFSHQEG